MLPPRPSFRATLVAASLLAAGLLAASVFAPATPPFPHRLEARASVTAAGLQHRTALDVAADGSTVVVWESRRQQGGTPGVYGRRFAADGRPLTAERRLNQWVRGAQGRPAVALAADGTAWVAWESSGHDGEGTAVVARRFAAGLEPLGGEIAVHLERAGDQASPTVAVGPDGRALVAWSTPGEEPGDRRVRARLFAAGGEPLSAELRLAEGDGRDDLPSAVALGDSGFAVAWARTASLRPWGAGGAGDRRGGGIFARRLDADGRPLGGELQLDGGEGGAIEPALAADASGRWAAAWLEDSAAGGRGVTWRRFDADGRPTGPPRRAEADAGSWTSGVALAAAADGRLALAWNRESARSDGAAIALRLLDAEGGTGGPGSGSPAVHPPGAGRRTLEVGGGPRRIAWGADGRLALAWSGRAGEADPDAAGLTVLLPAGATRPATPAAPADPALERAAEAVPPDRFRAAVPPIWNPDFEPTGRRPVAPLAGGDFGFEAVPGTVWTPPDPELAVGPSTLMVMTNGAIVAFDKLGNELWSDEIENSFGFWGELGTDNFVFDPEVKWDPHAGRFFAMACERSDTARSNFLLAVSRDDTPDDRDDWYKYRIDVTSLAGNDIDSPNLAMSAEHVLLSADFFFPDAYLLFVIDKASILDGGTPVTVSELITGTGQQSMGIPVVETDTPTLYILQSTELVTNTTVIVHAITDPFGSYQRQTFTLPVPAYTYPNSPPQKGTSSRPFLFEPRFWSVAERNGSLWAVHHVNSSRARVRWYEIPLNGWPDGGTPSLAQFGEIDLGGEIHTYFPSIDVDPLDNVAITFARSAPNEYISMGRALRAASDPAGELRPVQVVQVSQNAHTSGRWGDYSGTQADPVDPDTFWGHHEFTDGAVSSWRSWVARYDLTAEPLVLSAPPLVAGRTVDLEVSGAPAGATVTFVGSVAGTGITEAPPLGVVLSLESPRLAGEATADGSGVAVLSLTLPPGAAGRTVYLQATADGRTTNWLEEVVG